MWNVIYSIFYGPYILHNMGYIICSASMKPYHIGNIICDARLSYCMAHTVSARLNSVLYFSLNPP